MGINRLDDAKHYNGERGIVTTEMFFHGDTSGASLTVEASTTMIVSVDRPKPLERTVLNN